TDLGTGTSITFASGFFAEITDVSWDGIEREFIDKSHMGSTDAREFLIGDLYDPGSLTIQIHFQEATVPPITGTFETVTVLFPGGASMAASGALQSFSISDPLEDKMVATAVIKFSGVITWA
ncbi:MAG: hypothetical protein IID41_14890, partial [Planctomycetes bacterium]|nr:hypothetical protein [Planctomycetota bacterium]